MRHPIWCDAVEKGGAPGRDDCLTGDQDDQPDGWTHRTGLERFTVEGGASFMSLEMQRYDEWAPFAAQCDGALEVRLIVDADSTEVEVSLRRRDLRALIRAAENLLYQWKHCADAPDVTLRGDGSPQYCGTDPEPARKAYG